MSNLRPFACNTQSMGSPLLSQAEMADMLAARSNQFATFARAFTLYQDAIQTTLILDPNWNPLTFGGQNQTGNPATPQPITISGCILYDKQQEWSYARPYVGRGPNEGQLKIKDQTTRSVRIKVDPSGYALLGGPNAAKVVEIDGFTFNLESVARPHGLFGAEYYTFYYVRAL